MTAPSERTLSAPTYVYRVYDDADRVLYVGYTANLKQRFYEHSISARWRKYAVRRVLRGPYPRDVAYQVEQQLIAELQPWFNTRPGWRGHEAGDDYLRARGVRVRRVA